MDFSCRMPHAAPANFRSALQNDPAVAKATPGMVVRTAGWLLLLGLIIAIALQRLFQ